MTKNEARDILTRHNKWRRGAYMPMQNQQAIGIAIDAICEPSSIAQSIRNAAINWPQYLGDVECGVLSAFCYWDEWEYALHYGEKHDKINVRTFMLLVAEALE